MSVLSSVMMDEEDADALRLSATSTWLEEVTWRGNTDDDASREVDGGTNASAAAGR